MKFLKSLLIRFDGNTVIKNVADELPPPDLLLAEVEDDITFYKQKLQEASMRYRIKLEKTIH